MAQVIVEIGGRNYPLSCRDGEEAHLQTLARDIAARAEKLTAGLGAMSEARLLLMAALMIADELHDVRAGKIVPMACDAGEDARLARLADQAEALATALAG